MTSVLVLAGGPDSEREVSLMSARAIADALAQAGHEVHVEVINRPTIGALSAMPGEVVFPALHGPWGEGGPLQALLEMLGRPYVGSGPAAARRAMDKVESKSMAQKVGLDCKATCLFDPEEDQCLFEFPVVVKPINEGSTVGLHVCRNSSEWEEAHHATRQTGKPSMIEPFVAGRELTLGLIPSKGDFDALQPLPIIEIIPSDGLYDYDAKYQRDDTAYIIDPDLPPLLEPRLREQTIALARALEIRHLCRADFILDDDGRTWFLEINTMPGFTTHSLVPQAAQADGVEMPELCHRLIEAALAAAAIQLSARSASNDGQTIQVQVQVQEQTDRSQSRARLAG